MAKKQTLPPLTFDEQLILFQFFLRELGLESLSSLSKTLNSTEYEGVNESGNTYFFEYLSQISRINGSKISVDQLRLYDENICRHTRRISEKRGTVNWKYFQYIALLFTETYLDRYFGNAEELCKSLNEFLSQKSAETLGRVNFAPYTPDKMNKLAFMCATGSGKTLIMHVNILQFLHYFRRARRLNSRLSINKIIVLAPNEGMSLQHIDELRLSSISAEMFDKRLGSISSSSDVIVIDMNKLKEEGKVKTVSVDSFEQNNLVLVDEGHRGLSGNVWYEYRSKLSREGFSFEYSATFKQALNANATGTTDKAKEERKLMEEYGKSIIMDYSYKYFYQDGYGKDYRIYNLRSSTNNEQRILYLTGCLLSFYQQLKLYHTNEASVREFQIEQPLLVFVGNRVTAKTSNSELTDVEEVLDFINRFVSKRTESVSHIRQVLYEDTGLTNSRGDDLFYGDFYGLLSIFGTSPDPAAVFEDILRLVFNSDTGAEEPRLYLESFRQIPGEIGMKLSGDGEYFGVISIGDTAGLIQSCDLKGIASKPEEFVSDSLFRAINRKDSRVKMLIGSRKFTEGWNSWRVSTMGLINFAKGEGSQAIQLFGRGVRLKGYQGCLKRSRKLNNRSVRVPKGIELLETLTIFGVKAQYMEDFKKYLELEGAPTNDNLLKFNLPVISRYEEAKDKKLHVIKVKDGANFKKQAKRLILDVPDEGFLRYLRRSKTVIDCRSKIQTIESTVSLKITSVPEEHVLPPEILRFLDYQRIFEELEQYKNEKFYYNISIVKELLMEILRTEGWYSLIIPKHHMEIDSLQKLEAATDYAVMALKSYMDKFFRYEKDRWEAPLLEYSVLEPDDNNFVDEYTITYSVPYDIDHTGDELESFIADVSAILTKNNGLDAYEKQALHGQLVLFDFRNHLYAPLISLQKSNLKIQISPISLNEGEKTFVDRLKEYVEQHADTLKGKSLYLLRNKSKVGMGFFEAGNFYPDFILWIDDGQTQYISFIDPKGLRNVRQDDPKIQFNKTIKELEKRLAATAHEKVIVLNSFILSATPYYQLLGSWSITDADGNTVYLAERNVFMLDNPDCVADMMKKILG